MSKLSRRRFIGGAVAASGACVVGGGAIERVLDAKPTFEKPPGLTIDSLDQEPD